MSAKFENQDHDELKKRAAWISLGYNLSQTVLKLAGAVITGSLSLFSEAAHSGVDVFASLIALASVRAAAVPPDEEHPYGHGKVESVAALAESSLLVVVVGYVGFEAIQRMVVGAEMQSLGVGVAIMGISTFTSLLVARHVQSVAQHTKSLALRSNAQHLMVDFWTSVGVLGALLITWTTGWKQADSILALLLSLWLARGAWKLGKEAFHELIDRRIEPEELEAIETAIRETEGVLQFHRLRTRHSGHVHYVDVHIVVSRDWSVVQAHDVADLVERRVAEVVTQSVTTVHVDPFDPERDPMQADLRSADDSE